MKLSLPAALAVFVVLGEVRGDEDDAECEQKTENGKCCVFPFTFEGQQMHFCIRGGPSEYDWCATTNNFDRDGNWGLCTGVKCYVCTSDISWTDCESHQQAHNCPYMYDQCMILSKEAGIGNTSKLFHKRCTSNKLCSAYNPTCKGNEVMMCDFSCCMGDFCNTASPHYSKLGSFFPILITAWIHYMHG